jgi:glutathione reductase (NADPH)
MFEVAGSFGWQVDARFDWPTLVANKDKEIARLEAAYVAASSGRAARSSATAPC